MKAIEVKDVLGHQVNKNIIYCDCCGKEIKVSNYKVNNQKHHFCSKECYVNYQKRNQAVLICSVCGKEFARKKSQVDKMKDGTNATCSKQCCYELRKTLYKGENNHQFGLTGKKNGSWKSDERYSTSDNHYKLIRVENHPFRDKNNFVPQYKLVAEKYLLTKDNSIEIDGKLYLKPECVVHHIDFNKKNDDVNNLFIFPNEGIHILFHNLYKSGRVVDLNDFLKYYEDAYINKLYNYQWLYKAYISYDLSINKISKLFNIPYKSIQSEIYKHNLDNIKKQNKSKNEILNLIISDLSKKGDV